MPALFVTGTGTDIGKTYVSCALIRALKARGASSTPSSRWSAASIPRTRPQRPGSAGRRPGRSRRRVPHRPAPLPRPAVAQHRRPAGGRDPGLDDMVIDAVARAAELRDGLLLVEGAGGVMSPLTDGETNLDMIAALGAPVLLVAGSYLGTISHILTALVALRAAKARVAAVVLSESLDAPDLAQTAQALTPFLERRAAVPRAARGDLGRWRPRRPPARHVGERHDPAHRHDRPGRHRPEGLPARAGAARRRRAGLRHPRRRGSGRAGRGLADRSTARRSRRGPGRGLDGALVHAATAAHPDIVRRLLDAGVPTMVDKPIADNAAESEALVDLAETRGVSLMVGFNRRFAPVYRDAAALNLPLVVMQKNRADQPTRCAGGVRRLSSTWSTPCASWPPARRGPCAAGSRRPAGACGAVAVGRRPRRPRDHEPGQRGQRRDAGSLRRRPSARSSTWTRSSTSPPRRP
jgi:dethiobiotin synthetase